MIQIPWFIRFGVDISVFLTPVVLLATYPRTVFTFMDKKKRIKRRRSFDEVKLKEDPVYDLTFVKEYNKKFRVQEKKGRINIALPLRNFLKTN